MAIKTNPTANILDTVVLQDVAEGNLRITVEQARTLYYDMPLPELGRWADAKVPGSPRGSPPNVYS